MEIKNKKITKSISFLFFISIVLYVITEPALKMVHKGFFRVYEEIIIEPVFFSILTIIPTLALFLFCRPAIFRHWLIWIASWYVPLAVLVVSDTPVYGGSILSLNRTDAALWWSGGLLLITIAYLIVRTYLPRLKTFLVQRYNLD